MASNQELVQKAVTGFQNGYNCTQSILLTLFGHISPDGKSDLIPKIASGFGGGIGLSGSVCGALTGTILAVGIKYGSNEIGEENNLKAYAMSNTLFQMFEKQHGTVLCRNLIKYDLSKPEQVAKARQEGVFDKLCVNYVKTAVENYLAIENRQF
jgi:C_GCAxxG_C_C family probable redox protein